jgi:PAS domain S-box-containing protein
LRKKGISLLKNIQLIFSLSILILAGFFLILQISFHNQNFKTQAKVIETGYIEEQKSIVKREVERVVNLINMRQDTLNSTNDELTEDEKIKILREISNIRFGQEGYIFVNTFDAYALVSNGELIKDRLKLWEVFSDDIEKTRELFRKEYDAAQKPHGDFIYYSIQKLTNSEVESPKTSFIYGIPRLNWLVGAGIYLDDVHGQIEVLQKSSLDKLKVEIFKTVFFTLILIITFLFLIFLLSRKLQADFSLFTEFFDKAVLHNVKINPEMLKFQELRALADSANIMQSEKIEAQQRLLEGKEKLRLSEQNFRLLAEYSKDMIFRMSLPDGLYEYISPASVDILGYTPQEIMDEPFHVRRSIHPDWKEWLEKSIENLNRGEAQDTFEYQLIHKSGKVLWVTQKNTLIKDDEGRVIGMVGRVSDETERKHIEEKLNHSSKMEAIGQLAGGVAHDFNNVLAGIINAAQVLKSSKRQIDDKGKLMAELILNAAMRAADLTAKLSAFSRKRMLVQKPQDLHSIIDETISLLKRTVDKKIILRKEFNAANHYVIGDGSELQSALMNLGINASHAMETGGEILISTSNLSLSQKYCDASLFNIKPGEFIQVEVRDHGCGIKPGDLNRIFDPFFSTKEQGKGTGLGLATVYGAVLSHKGALEVKSELDVGTSIFIQIPCSLETPEIQDVEQNSLLGSGKILVVDDEEVLRYTTRDMLEDMGYSVVLCENGKKAVELFHSIHNEIDLVLMDVIMPEMNGSEAFYKMKEIDRDCRIILTSGYTRDENISGMMKQGLSAFLKKPFSDVELFRIIQKTLES